LARAQVRAISLRRLPFGVFRLVHYAKSYRECMRNFVLSSDRPEDPVRAVLVPRHDGDQRSVTGPLVIVES